MKPSCELITRTDLSISLQLLENEYAAELEAQWEAHEGGSGPKPTLDDDWDALCERIEAISFSLSSKYSLNWELDIYGSFDLTLRGGDAETYRAYYNDLIREIKESPYAKWVITPEWESNA